MSLYFLLGTLTATGQQNVHDNRDLSMETSRSIQVKGAEILGRIAVAVGWLLGRCNDRGRVWFKLCHRPRSEETFTGFDG